VFLALPIVDQAPATPQTWSATVNTSSYGTMPIPPELGNVQFKQAYDYVNKREKHVFLNGEHAGQHVVYRWDKKQPGEPWSQAYAWVPGKEALCCYINLCTSEPCTIDNAERMSKLEVDSKATDMGPSGAHGERWHADMSIKVLKIGNVNDWIVDTELSMAVTNWTSNASAPHMGWEHAVNLYTDISLGNLTEADFAYPKFCNEHMCESNFADSMRNVDVTRRHARVLATSSRAA
jgi:hypothetical protein